jgi:hypothetical protein
LAVLESIASAVRKTTVDAFDHYDGWRPSEPGLASSRNFRA